MVCSPVLLLFISVIIFLITVVCQDNGTVPLGSSLTAATGKTNPWLSSSGDFAFGFQQVQQKKNQAFLLSIWYNKIPDKTIVWYGYDGNVVESGSKVQLSADLGLVLTDPKGKELWYSGSMSAKASGGFLNDTGNFQILGSDSSILWDSFSSPTDTLLPTQTMQTDGVLYSRMTDTNFAKGRFQLHLQRDGNLVLSTRDILTGNIYNDYYWSNTASINTSEQGVQVKFDKTGYVYVLRRNGTTVNITTNIAIPSPGYYHRTILNFDGVLVQYYHPEVVTETSKWTSVWQEPDNICLDIQGKTDSGACGYNSVCRLDDSRRPVCECPQGYSLLSEQDDMFGSCKPDFTLNCDDNRWSSAEDFFEFVELANTDWPLSDYEELNPISELECQKSCMYDCYCPVAIYTDGTCWKKRFPLSNGMKDNARKSKAFVKVRKSSLPPETYSHKLPSTDVKKDRGRLNLIQSVLLGSSVFVNFVFVLAACIGFFCIYQKKNTRIENGISSIQTYLQMFTYKQLAEATDGFSEELGRGAFGIVYKGVVRTSFTSTIIAVKKLDKLTQDSHKEFQAEANAIAQTHHKNLVRLVGLCEEEEHCLLVYEYMVNGTLANFVFGDARPTWTQRSHIAMGVARGLAYLHEECSTQIIHCDIKPQNILLDEHYNARISDFGLAKLLMMNQSRTNTGIRGTKGYVAPEWFRNTPITVKVDVYSFGVLLLEIICCRRSVEDLESGDKAILTYWVWDCFEDGRLEELAEDDETVLSDWMRVERFVMVGIWCTQEDPSLRPTMRKVVQMLEGVVDVPKPPCP